MKSEKCSFEKLPYRYFSEVFEDEILIYELDQNLYAISGFCPHFGGPLEIKEGKINCYWHDWDFDIRKHNCVNKKVNLSIRPYKIQRISSNQVLIEDAN